MTDHLVQEITGGGGQIRTCNTALNLSVREEGGYAVTSILEDCTAQTLTCDAVIACIAGRQFANIARCSAPCPAPIWISWTRSTTRPTCA